MNTTGTMQEVMKVKKDRPEPACKKYDRIIKRCDLRETKRRFGASFHDANCFSSLLLFSFGVRDRESSASSSKTQDIWLFKMGEKERVCLPSLLSWLLPACLSHRF